MSKTLQILSAVVLTFSSNMAFAADKPMDCATCCKEMACCKDMKCCGKDSCCGTSGKCDKCETKATSTSYVPAERSNISAERRESGYHWDGTTKPTAASNWNR